MASIWGQGMQTISPLQRKAFGRRYSYQSPLAAEKARIGNEYALAANRGAMGMQANAYGDAAALSRSQFEQSRAIQQAQYDRSEARGQANFDKQMDLQGSGMGGPNYGNVPGAYGYLSRYPEVGGNLYYQKDPYAHYLQYGKGEGKTWVGEAPPEWSDAEKEAFYLYMYPDVRNSGMTGKRHYEAYGKAEGRFWPSRTGGTAPATTTTPTTGSTWRASPGFEYKPPVTTPTVPVATTTASTWRATPPIPRDPYEGSY